MSELRSIINRNIEAYKNLDKATDYYNDSLVVGNNTLNTRISRLPMEYIKEAEEEFIELYKQDILKYAKNILKEDLESCGIPVEEVYAKTTV